MLLFITLDDKFPRCPQTNTLNLAFRLVVVFCYSFANVRFRPPKRTLGWEFLCEFGELKLSKNRLIIHAGTHKTGTSAIQNYLFEHGDSLKFRYLHRGVANSSLWMLHAFAHDLTDLVGFRHLSITKPEALALRQRARGDLEASISSLRGGDALISAESLSLMKQPELEDVYRYFSGHFDVISVHIYFRPMKSRMESAFQERLKGRRTSLTDKYKLGYAGGVRMLDETFGRENVHVHNYRRDCFPGGDVVQHFLDAVGEAYTPTRAFNDNLSLSLPAIQLLYCYRQKYPVKLPGDLDLIHKLSTLPGPPLRFHSTLFKELLVAKQRGISAFEKRAGFSISEDIEAFDSTSVRNEGDLLNIPDSSVKWLESNTPRTIAQKLGIKKAAPVAEQMRALAELSSKP